MPFELRKAADIDGQLYYAQKYCTNQTRVFLGAGDALILPQKKLLELCAKISAILPDSFPATVELCK